MDLLHYFGQHRPELLGWAATGCIGWLVTNTVGKPILRFEQTRMSALRALEEHWSVGPTASEERAREAHKALRASAAELQSYTNGGGPAVRLHCMLMRYDIENAPGVFRGSHGLLVDGYPDDQRRNAQAACKVT